jgi:hypothetical protein
VHVLGAGYKNDAVGLTLTLYLALIFAVPPIIATIQIIRRLRKPRQPGKCQVCGYDLRATPDRCPECGAIPAKETTAG